MPENTASGPRPPFHDEDPRLFSADCTKTDRLRRILKASYRYAFVPTCSSDDEPFHYDDWIRMPGVAIVSCNDGMRPVIFTQKHTDEDPAINLRLFSSLTHSPSSSDGSV